MGRGVTGGCMSIVAWLLLGLIAGFIASKVVNRTGAGLILDIILGMVGALLGGALFNALGSVGVTGFNLWSLFVATIGAVIALLIYHVLTRRRRL